MHDIAGLVALAIVGLWIAYLVPHRLRYRQQLLESRTEDRFSDALRVLVVTDPRGRADRGADRAECGADRSKRCELLSPARGVPVAGRQALTDREGGVVERPYGTQDKISADAARRQAQLRSQRAAALARRAAAARRRALLTVALLVVAAGAWVVVGLTSLAVMAAVVPTVLLVGVLGLGRRAVLQGQAADAAWEQQQRRLATVQAVGGRRSGPITGRALHPSDSHTEAVPQVRSGGVVSAPGDRRAAEIVAASTPVATAGTTVSVLEAPGATTSDRASTSSDDDVSATTVEAEAEAEAGAAEVAAGEGADKDADGWSPVPVPRPTYTTKATAPRREPLPLVVEEPAAAVDGGSAEDAEAPVSTPPAIDLDAVLARRRAAGE
ncbi:hypothetical protein [Cellulomonas aerilata]|uniref:hypothetical protein n=1 Tax=Cellulomonas aerilata TaxID=515326 RepID=UPI0011BDD158|nr:hypothetical protein [Cellulomonas aerilata]